MNVYLMLRSCSHRGAYSGLCLLLAGLILFAGCGETAPAKQTTTTKKKPTPGAPTPPKPVDPNAYASVDEALAAVVAGFEEPTKAKDINTAQQWMQSKGASIEPQIVAKLKSEQTHLAARIMCCRVLAQMGPVAIPTLKEMTGPGPHPDQLRQNAVDCLGMVKPSDKQVIDHLIKLGWDPNEKVRLAALRGLAKIGPPVKQANPEVVQKLMAVLNSTTEEEAVRIQAKATLKSIEPRQGFAGMGKIDQK